MINFCKLASFVDIDFVQYKSVIFYFSLNLLGIICLKACSTRTNWRTRVSIDKCRLIGISPKNSVRSSGTRMYPDQGWNLNPHMTPIDPWMFVREMWADQCSLSRVYAFQIILIQVSVESCGGRSSTQLDGTTSLANHVLQLLVVV